MLRRLTCFFPLTGGGLVHLTPWTHLAADLVSVIFLSKNYKFA